MTHEDARDLLLELAYGELAPGAARDVSRHVAASDACAAELDRIAAVRGMASRLGEGPGPSAPRDELVRTARSAVAARPARRWWTRPATLSFAGAAAVVAIVAGVTLKLTRDDLGRVGTGSRPGELRPVTPEVTPERTPVEVPGAAPSAHAGSDAEAPAPQAVPSAPPARREIAHSGSVASGREQRPERIPARGERPPVASAPRFAAPPPTAAAAPPAAAETSRAMAAAPTAAPARKAAAEPRDRSAERPSESGGLVEERRTLRCGEVVVERVALVAPGGRVVRLTERRDGAVVEGWYDEDGRLRPERSGDAHAGGPSADTATAERATARVLPATAPTLEQVATSCGW